jgi:glutamyl-tRNA synthetase
MSSPVRVRFAPSPTGYLHVGGARTALFNYLFARRLGGTFVLRIEDTDRSRFQAGACDEIYESLRWLGLTWDEGPGVGGPYGPYVQSERTDLYRQHADKLLASGHAYRCFCTPERIKEVREAQEKAKVASVSGYDRHCRSLPDAEVQRLLADGTPHVVRLKVPLGQVVRFHDEIRGDIEYQSDALDDQVLLKSDGFPTYHLANVVDDHFMQISHVMRAEEWITSTPRHVLLYQAFGWEPPRFAHLPLILSPDGGKLSKRKGAASVMDFKKSGHLPEALFNFLALLGWSPGADKEKMTRQEIIDTFGLERVSPKASAWDEKKLEWMNGLYMQERTVDSILPDIVDILKSTGTIAAEVSATDPYVRTVVGLLKDRSKRLVELAQSATYFFADPTTYEEQAVKKHFKGDARATLVDLHERLAALQPFNQSTTEELYRAYAEEKTLSAGKLIHPTRLAVSGVSFGPGLFELLEVLGQDKVLRRITAAIAWLGANQQA